ncbi:hypothetical protein D3C77_309120 [compost metagenome]
MSRRALLKRRILLSRSSMSSSSGAVRGNAAKALFSFPTCPSITEDRPRGLSGLYVWASLITASTSASKARACCLSTSGCFGETGGISSTGAAISSTTSEPCRWNFFNTLPVRLSRCSKTATPSTSSSSARTLRPWCVLTSRRLPPLAAYSGILLGCGTPSSFSRTACDNSDTAALFKPVSVALYSFSLSALIAAPPTAFR